MEKILKVKDWLKAKKEANINIRCFTCKIPLDDKFYFIDPKYLSAETKEIPPSEILCSVCFNKLEATIGFCQNF